MLIGLSLLFISGIVFSEFFKKLGLPHFLGIILAGVLVKGFLPTDFYDIAVDLKRIALVVLMTRVSFNLRVNEIKEIGAKAGLVSFIPTLLELIGVALVFHFVFDYSATSSLVMGAVMAATSPAISVPLLLKTKLEGYGVKKRIPQMLIAAGGVDNAFAIVMFYTLLNFEIGGGIKASGLLNIPIAFITGAIAGFVMYNLNVFLITGLKLKGAIRIILTLSTSFYLLGLEDIASQYVSYSGIIAILTVGILLLYKHEELAHELSIAYTNIWSFVEILLFGIVGASVHFDALGKYLVLGIFITICSMCFRIIAMHFALIGSGFTEKEKLFCGLTLTAKATVQASLGGIPLAMGYPYGDMILAVSVISIFLSSPTCAILINKTYSKFLTKDIDTSYLNE